MTEAPTISDLLTRVEGLTGPDREVDGRIMFELFARPVGDRGFIWPEDNPSWSFALIFKNRGPDALKERERKAAAREHERPKEWIEWGLPDGRWLLMNDLRVPPLTASLDSALALVERVKPDWYVRIQGCNSAWYAEINPTRAGSFHGSFEANGSTAPLALLAALLKSLAHAE